MKTCNRCGEEKPLNDFVVGTNRKVIGKCYQCRLDVKNEWRSKNKEKLKAQLARQKENASAPDKLKEKEENLLANTKELIPEYTGIITDELRLIKCTGCNRVLPIIFYTIDVTRKLGYQTICSDCKTSRYGSTNPIKLERVAFNKLGRLLSDDEKLCPACGFVKHTDEFHKSSRTRDGRHSHCAACRSVKNLISGEAFKRKAQHAVSVARETGKLVPPFCCEECLSPSDSLDAHHEDYSKPYDVRWLCKKCHHEYHQHVRFISMEISSDIEATAQHFEALLEYKVLHIVVYHRDKYKQYVLIKVDCQ